MAFDEGLGHQVCDRLQHRTDVVEKRMFGGLAFLIRGHMAIGVMNVELMVRLGGEGTRTGLEEPHTRAMGLTGRVMKSMLWVTEEGTHDEDLLVEWVERGIAFAMAQPPK